MDRQHLAIASAADRWLYLLLHAQDYEPVQLRKLVPELAFLKAIETLVEISEKTEDKAMYDSRQKAIRDYEYSIKTAVRQAEERGVQIGEARGEARGKIRTLQSILSLPVITDEAFAALDQAAVAKLIDELQQQLRLRA